MKYCTGKIFFNEPQLYALWKYEICGQLSDGHWENAEPLDHWQFWCRLDPVYDSTASLHVQLEQQLKYDVKKNAYALVDLAELLSERMLRLARAAIALPSNLDDRSFVEEVTCNFSNAVPETLAQFLMKYNSNEKVAFTLPQAVAYYTTEYSRKNLRKDLRKISRLMKTVKLSRST